MTTAHRRARVRISGRTIFYPRPALAALALIAAAAAAYAKPPAEPPPSSPPVVAPPPAASTATPRKAPAPQPAEPPADRGRLLYENHCTGCHASVVHVREQRRATHPAALEAWIRRWVETLGLPWRDEEIAAVAEYLDRRYYHFSPPPAPSPDR